ncbi:hypothetical protein ACHHYP_15829 [Achlya hypogyna]|uniref:Uncharacterized protein n=1 Tax=Achlya hypogyna TaxID=1202772 RepID=A0A1V9ZEM2_ACHHY|nr:hypothetical protein ACHHYP_15829 [Achlya hypogyna]
MDELRAKKAELLLAQQEKADRFHELLVGPGGLNEASRKTCKNLEAAITASKKPGYFLYYEQPDVVKAVVKNGELRKLQGVIVQLQQKIDQIDAELANHAAKAAAAPVTNEVQSLKQWFSTYGTPKPVTSGMLTSFATDPKVYGGTEHYSAFKSQSLTMKKGRLTK